MENCHSPSTLDFPLFHGMGASYIIPQCFPASIFVAASQAVTGDLSVTVAREPGRRWMPASRVIDSSASLREAAHRLIPLGVVLRSLLCAVASALLYR